jgi:hypothetical protein
MAFAAITREAPVLRYGIELDAFEPNRLAPWRTR